MNLGEFRKKTAHLAGHIELMLRLPEGEEFAFAPVETVQVKAITMRAPELPKKEWATEEVLLLEDQ